MQSVCFGRFERESGRLFVVTQAAQNDIAQPAEVINDGLYGRTCFERNPAGIARDGSSKGGYGALASFAGIVVGPGLNKGRQP